MGSYYSVIDIFEINKMSQQRGAHKGQSPNES